MDQFGKVLGQVYADPDESKAAIPCAFGRQRIAWLLCLQKLPGLVPGVFQAPATPGLA